MKRNLLIGGGLLFAVMSLMLGGCMTTKEARSVEPKGVLFDPAILSKGEGDQVLQRYLNPRANLKEYRKVMIAPVKFFKPAQASPEELTDLQNLANNFNQYLFAELSKDYNVVLAPEAGTLRIETAITQADKSNPTMDFISTVLPIGLAVSIVKDSVTGKPLNVGEISGEVKITDATTGELMAAAADSRVGGKSFKGMFSSWSDANHAMEYWATKLRYMLCTNRKDTGCVAPSNY
jgi:hypothetical protein